MISSDLLDIVKARASTLDLLLVFVLPLLYACKFVLTVIEYAGRIFKIIESIVN